MKLTSLNQNMWLLPPPFSADNDSRLEKAIKLAKDLNPDMITWQEVWLNEYVDRMMERLSSDYFIEWSGKNSFYNKGGMVTLTKAIPEYAEFFPFKRTIWHNPIEWIACKGCLKVRADYGGKRATILNTHVYRAYTKSGEKISISQVESLKGLTDDDSCINLALGDLNIDLITFLAMNNCYFSMDHDNSDTVSSKNIYSNMRFNMFNPNDEKVDHVLKRGEGTLESKVLKEMQISDHYPMLSEISF